MRGRSLAWLWLVIPVAFSQTSPTRLAGLDPNSTSTGDGGAALDGVPEGLKEPGVRPVRAILGMPLHRQHEALRRKLQGLYHVVRSSGDYHQPARHPVHALMVA